MKNKITIKKSKIKNAGRGVFAATDIREGEIIEICPILIFTETETERLMQTQIGNYIYDYDLSRSIFALGFGSLYNHNIAANAGYELIVYKGQPEQDSELCITSLRHISKNEEIFINYGKDNFVQ